MQKMILLCRHFCSRTFSFSHVDIFVIVFRCTNILFGAPSCRLRYFSKDKRKRLWEHKCGVEGKMMRLSPHMWGGEKIENEIEWLVKILTKCEMKLRSRKEEIKWNCGARLAAARALLRSTLSIPALYLSLHHVQSTLGYLAYVPLPPPRIRRASHPAILAPAVSLSLFFFIKLSKH